MGTALATKLNWTRQQGGHCWREALEPTSFANPLATLLHLGKEANVNLQFPVVRLGLKQRLLEQNNLSLEFGAGGYWVFPLATPPPGGQNSPTEFRGIFDVGLLYGHENWYFIPRYSLVSLGGFDYVSQFQFHVGYTFTPNPLLELGFYATPRGSTGFSLSLGLHTANP